MKANPKVGYATLNTKFSATVYGNTWDVTYSWNFGDWHKAVWRVVEHPYTKSWNYNAVLVIEDKLTWKRVTDSVVIKVLEKKQEDNLSDIDKDWILDKDDYCVSVFWVKENNWCPIFEKECKVNSDCTKWKMCDGWYCVLDTDWDKVPDNKDNCRLTPWLIDNKWCPAGAIWENCYMNKNISWVCGSASCNSCPCPNEVNFKADLRKCDLVFPTILSPDWKDIYAKWQNKIIEK
jgi:hypothetical protein